MKTVKRILVLILTFALCLMPAKITTYAAGTGTILVIREDVVTGEKLAGAVYNINKGSDGSYVCTITTDSSGTATYELEPDSYIVSEVTAPIGYEQEQLHHIVTVTEGQTTTVPIKTDINHAVLVSDGIHFSSVHGVTPTPQEIMLECVRVGRSSTIRSYELAGADNDKFTVSEFEANARFYTVGERKSIGKIQPTAGLPIGSYRADLVVTFRGVPSGDLTLTVPVSYDVRDINHTISTTAGTGGSINPSGVIDVADSDDQTFTITAESGYKISDVKVDDVSIGAVSTYKFENVTEDHTIHAEFVSAGTGGTTGNTGGTSSTTTTRSSSGGSGGTTATPSTSKNTVTPQQIGDYSWRVDLPVLGYVEASVDGVPLVKGEDCVVKSGSTILTLTDSYVNSLRSGTHTLRMEFLSATATIDFTVTPTGTGGGDVGEPNAPALSASSNDNMNPSTGGVEAAGSIAVLLAVVGLWAVVPRKIGR